MPVLCRHCGNPMGRSAFAVGWCRCHGTTQSCSTECIRKRVCVIAAPGNSNSGHYWNNREPRTDPCHPVCNRQHYFMGDISRGEVFPYDSEVDRHIMRARSATLLYCEKCVPYYATMPEVRHWLETNKEATYFSLLGADGRRVLASYLYHGLRGCDVCGLYGAMYPDKRYGFENICVGCESLISRWWLPRGLTEEDVGLRAKSRRAVKAVVEVVNKRVSSSNSRQKAKRRPMTYLMMRKKLSLAKAMAEYDRALQTGECNEKDSEEFTDPEGAQGSRQEGSSDTPMKE